MAEKETETRTPTRWDPFGEGWLTSWPMRDFMRPMRLPEAFWGRAGSWVPAMDVSEDDRQYVITVELPGTKREDVTLESHENRLTIRGEKRDEREEKKEHRRYVERSFGSFSRSFSLPNDADSEHIEASFENGVLSICIPKLEEAKPRTVDIKG